MEVPTTTDELVEVLKAFRDGNPEGRTDIIPMSFIMNGGNEDPGILLGAFGEGDNQDQFLVTDDKKVIYSTVQEGYKEGIKWLNFQNEGLFDPEAYTQDWEIMYQRVITVDMECSLHGMLQTSLLIQKII